MSNRKQSLGIGAKENILGNTDRLAMCLKVFLENMHHTEMVDYRIMHCYKPF